MSVVQADEEELGLSAAALAALTEFGLAHSLPGFEPGAGDVRRQIQSALADDDSEETFTFTYSPDSSAAETQAEAAERLESVTIELRGRPQTSGQTLQSTGLTVWSASQALAKHLWYTQSDLSGKSIIELGSGLGLCVPQVLCECLTC